VDVTINRSQPKPQPSLPVPAENKPIETRDDPPPPRRPTR
jgi:hypothetical protein